MIKSVQVLSSAGGTSSEILSTVNKLFLFSYAELGFGSVTPYAQEIDGEAESTSFPLFTNNASRIRKRFNGTGSADIWWMRSPHATSASIYWCVADNGSALQEMHTYNLYARGVCFGFCI